MFIVKATCKSNETSDKIVQIHNTYTVHVSTMDSLVITGAFALTEMPMLWWLVTLTVHWKG